MSYRDGVYVVLPDGATLVPGDDPEANEEPTWQMLCGFAFDCGMEIGRLEAEVESERDSLSDAINDYVELNP